MILLQVIPHSLHSEIVNGGVPNLSVLVEDQKAQQCEAEHFTRQFMLHYLVHYEVLLYHFLNKQFIECLDLCYFRIDNCCLVCDVLGFFDQILLVFL